MMLFPSDSEHPVVIPCGEKNLEGILHIPKDAYGFVLFAHGSGSSRFSVRNQFVARSLNEVKLATLLFDLLTPKEEAIDAQTLEFRFDIPFLANRLLVATDWLDTLPFTENLPRGYFGASTGGGAALVAAAKRPKIIKAVVSRGGRPDLAGDELYEVRSPTLLIVGENDEPVIEMNREAMEKIKAPKRLEIIPGAAHLFEEPGKLIEVADLAKRWFEQYLTK